MVVLSRGNGVDLVEGSGLTRAMRGASVVIDVSKRPSAWRRAVSKQTQKTDESRHFLGTVVTRRLLAAEKQAGVSHHVVLSVVGVDDAPEGYAGKMLQEELMSADVVPWTILRATQFHELAQQIPGAVRVGPAVVVPKMISRPIAARDVADRVVELAVQGSSGRA